LLEKAVSDALKIITRPLEELVNKDQPLSETLEQLAVLDIRFNKRYAFDIDWTSTSEIDTSLYDMLKTLKTRDLVRVLNASDVDRVRQLTVKGIMQHDEACKEIGRQWDLLCQAVSERLCLSPSSVHKFLVCAEVC
jgi:hypothetical protein